MTEFLREMAGTPFEDTAPSKLDDLAHRYNREARIAFLELRGEAKALGFSHQEFLNAVQQDRINYVLR